MDDADDLLADALRALLARACTPQVVRDIEAGITHQALWQLLEESGFADALLPEREGGAGLALPQAFALIELCGAHALPLPLAETMFARAWLAEAGVVRPAGSLTFARGVALPDGGVRCALVPSGRVAGSVLVACGTAHRLLRTADAQATPAAFCLDAAMQWPASAWSAATVVAPLRELRTVQACISAAQLAGALMQVFERTLQYANERQQFGRAIGKFQAIQHQLAVIAEHAFAARMAARLGCEAAGAVPDRLRVAVAKARTSEAALEVAALAHAIHGAIGFTAEFDLQLFTRRLHAWRQVAGSESYWHDVAGQALLDAAPGVLALDAIRQITGSAADAFAVS